MACHWSGADGIIILRLTGSSIFIKRRRLCLLTVVKSQQCIWKLWFCAVSYFARFIQRRESLKTPDQVTSWLDSLGTWSHRWRRTRSSIVPPTTSRLIHCICITRSPRAIIKSVTRAINMGTPHPRSSPPTSISWSRSCWSPSWCSFSRCLRRANHPACIADKTGSRWTTAWISQTPKFGTSQRGHISTIRIWRCLEARTAHTFRHVKNIKPFLEDSWVNILFCTKNSGNQ